MEYWIPESDTHRSGGHGRRAQAKARSTDFAFSLPTASFPPLPLWKRLRRDLLFQSAVVVLLLVVIGVVVGPLVYSPSPTHIDFAQALLLPSLAHPFGTNDMGQDILAQVLMGGRISITVGFCTTAVALLFGTLVGAVSGFAGGVVDILLMRLTDLFLALPLLPLLLLIMHLFQKPVTSAMGNEHGTFALIVLVIGSLTWMEVARLVRAHILSVREMDFVTAARVLGASPLRLVWSHILPNVQASVIVAATLAVSRAIVTESTLSFLGLGFPPDTPTWGRMLYESRDFLDIAPHMAIFPALAIVLTVLSVNFIGDGLQRVLNPRAR
jgi:peptide/nickel transport system permease protein